MSAAVKITRTDHSPAELRAIAAKNDNSAQARRLLAIARVLEGALRADAARQAGRKLTEAQMAELRELVIAGPDPDIHGVVRWRCVDLRDEVARRFSVTVDEAAVRAPVR
jgi:hypothetical protein